MKISILTNIPTPYRNPVYSILSKFDKVDLLVLYCSYTEPNRSWEPENLDFKHKFLSNKKDRLVHLNWNVYKELNHFKPNVVITSGFNPTMLFAWFWTLTNRKKHISFSDANLHSESKLSIFHRLIRKLVYKTSDAFIGASEKTLDLYRSYNVDNYKLFKSCLAVKNDFFSINNNEERTFDLMFCGQFIDRKNPLFFTEVAICLNKLKPGIKVLLVGSGFLKGKCISLLKENNVSFYDTGFVQAEKLPNYYHLAKLFLFPTKKDPWGLVANEALAAGLPVFVTSYAGVANELVIDGFNGFIFNRLDVLLWTDKIVSLLENSELFYRMSENAKSSVKRYTHENAAKGIKAAIDFALL